MSEAMVMLILFVVLCFLLGIAFEIVKALLVFIGTHFGWVLLGIGAYLIYAEIAA
jgi:hypothetical protein